MTVTVHLIRALSSQLAEMMQHLIDEKGAASERLPSAAPGYTANWQHGIDAYFGR
jgi:hypothetical protein